VAERRGLGLSWALQEARRDARETLPDPATWPVDVLGGGHQQRRRDSAGLKRDASLGPPHNGERNGRQGHGGAGGGWPPESKVGAGESGQGREGVNHRRREEAEAEKINPPHGSARDT